MNGKWNFVGVYTGGMNYAQLPAVWPTCFLALVLEPLQKEFRLFIRIVRPDGQEFMHMEGQIGLENLDPTGTVVVPVQIPPAPFTGMGQYKVLAGSSSENLEEIFNFTLTIANPAQRTD